MASKEATYAGIKAAGVDARLGEIGGMIEEIICSHEVEINGITYPSRTFSGRLIHSSAGAQSERSHGEQGLHPRGQVGAAVQGWV